jgi:hypothetical protein
VLAATRNTSLYSDQPSLFACLLSSLAPQLPISLRQNPQLDNGSDVVLLRFNGRKAGSSFFTEVTARITGCRAVGTGSYRLRHQPVFSERDYAAYPESVRTLH